MARVPLSKAKERAKAKIKAGKKASEKKPGFFSLSDTQVRYANGKPVFTAIPKKAATPVKKVETKKPAPKKPAPKPMSKEMLEKIKTSGNAFFYNKKTGKFEANPDFKNIVKKIGDSKKEQSKKVKSKIESLKRPEIRKETIKPEVVVTPRKKSEPTVSQLWQEKTGTSWSEAKKLGLTDGTASSNIALMKKLKSGSVNRNTIKSDKAATDTEPFRKEMEQNVQDELSGKIKFDEPVPTMRRGGSVKIVRKKIPLKRKK